MKLRDLAERLECRLDGDGDVEVERVAGIEHAGPGDLTFLSNPRYAAALRTHARVGGHPGGGCAARRRARCCAARNPYLSFARAIRVFAGEARARRASTR